MSEDQLDAIVVGAGIAGSTAAYLLASAGLEVALIERGPFPGSKNLSGGVLYGKVLHNILPNFWEEAPIERIITRQVISFLTHDAHFNIDFKDPTFATPPYNAVTVLRSKFDRWLAGKAEKAGAMLVPGIKVDRVLKEGSQVVGVAAGDDEMRADVVVAADGVLSFIAQNAGLRGPVDPKHAATGVKEVIALPPEVIRERFIVDETEGAAYTFVGYATRGVPGGGFLYTNQESISLGLVIRLDDLVRAKARPAEILEDFKAHPSIAPLIEGGRLVEYGAHVVPEGGVAMMPPLSTGGLLLVGDAAGLGINNGFAIRGMDLAIGSAAVAVDTILAARARSDFSAESLKAYGRSLDQSYVMKDMRTYTRAPHFLSNERLFAQYPEMLNRLMFQMYEQNATPNRHLVPTLIQSMKESGVSVFDLLKDMMEGARAL